LSETHRENSKARILLLDFNKLTKVVVEIETFSVSLTEIPLRDFPKWKLLLFEAISINRIEKFRGNRRRR
jgi:hypothetical protein